MVQRVFLSGVVVAIFLLCGVFLPGEARAATYCTSNPEGNCYVDGGVEASGDGKTPASAFKTIQEAADVVGPGDTVNVKGGMVYSTSTPTSAVVSTTAAGTSDNYIMYQAWEGTGIPVVDGSGTRHGFRVFRDYITVTGFEITNAKYGVLVYLSDNVIVSNNVIHDCLMDGIYLDCDINHGVNVFHNTLYNNDGGIGVEASAATDINEFNNIAVSGYLGILAYTESGDVQIDNNIVWDNEIDYEYCSPGLHDISADPLFVDAENGDFRLQAGSPAINAGATLSEVETDILGVSRPQGDGHDIGAFEYYALPVSLTALSPNPTTDSTPTLTGTAATIAEGEISAIEYSLNGGVWSTTGVTGTDSFSITLPELSDGTYTIRVRAVDSFGNTTDATLYGTDTFSVDTTPPELPVLPGYTGGVNVEEGATITDPLYTLIVKPTDATAVDRVEFYVDDTLLCTVREADEDGMYSCVWDTTQYHSDILIRVYDTVGNVSEITRTVTVELSAEQEETTGELAQTGHLLVLPFLAVIPSAVVVGLSHRFSRRVTGSVRR